MPRIVFHRLAERELLEAMGFYESAMVGLESAFLDEVERCLAGIADHPARGARIRRTLRRVLLRGFPYGVIYRVRGSEIRILAIVNSRRQPAYWAGRR